MFLWLWVSSSSGDEVEFDSSTCSTFDDDQGVERMDTRSTQRGLRVWAIYRDYDKEMPSPNAVVDLQFRYDFAVIGSVVSEAITGVGRVVRLEKLAGRKPWLVT